MTADQRARANAAFAELGRAEEAIKTIIKEQERDLNAALAEIGRLRTEVQRLHKEIDHLQAEMLQMERSADENALAAAEAEAALAAQHAETARLRADLTALREETDATPARRAVPVSEAAPRVAEARAPDAATPDAAVGAAFRSWCGAASPVMGKAEFFAVHVRASLPGASVTAVYRDANSQASPVALHMRGGASPVEHWLVALDGRHWLLPQPMAAGQFRELGPCFDGDATPMGLTAIVPAEVRVVGDRYEIAAPGRVA